MVLPEPSTPPARPEHSDDAAYLTLATIPPHQALEMHGAAGPRRSPPAPGGPPPAASDFDEVFSAVPASSGFRRLWALATPELPLQVEPFSFVSAGLLVTWPRPWTSRSGQRLVDLGCGRGGPGPWLARSDRCLAGAGGLLIRRDRPGGAAGGAVRAAQAGPGSPSASSLAPGYPKPARMRPSPSMRSISPPSPADPDEQHMRADDRDQHDRDEHDVPHQHLAVDLRSSQWRTWS